MSKFRITYTSGLVEEVETSEAETIEQFINIKFGIEPALIEAGGVLVELLIEIPTETEVEHAE